jgi:hypothetical protein
MGRPLAGARAETGDWTARWRAHVRLAAPLTDTIDGHHYLRSGGVRSGAGCTAPDHSIVSLWGVRA